MVLGSYSTRQEGLFDPWEFVQAMKRKATDLGAEFVQGTVAGATYADNGQAVASLDLDLGPGAARLGAVGVGTVVNAAGYTS